MIALSGFLFGLNTLDTKAQAAPGCTTYNGHIYCRGFRSTDPQGSSCNAACSARGYTCPVGDNMLRSVFQIATVARALGLLGSTESYGSAANPGWYSPYIRTTLSSGAKMIYYDSGWNQICTHAPGTNWSYERIKICRCQGSTVNYTLSVRKSGTGSGTVVSSPSGINCGTTCSASYSQGTTVTLTATPDSNSIFAGWSGACTDTKDCTVTMDSDKSVTANFGPSEITFTLTGTITGSSFDKSAVRVSAPGHSPLSYRDSFTRDYPAGTIINLTVVPDTGSVFAGWSGACTGTKDCTVTMNSDKSVVATINNTLPECTTYNGYTYCRSFKSDEVQGSSCQAACSQRGLICQTGDNMFRSSRDILTVATDLGIFTSAEYCRRISSVSTYVQRAYNTGSRLLYENHQWYQDCNFAQNPNDSDWKYINICRCRSVLTGRIGGTGYGMVNVNPPNLNYSGNFTRTYDGNPAVTLTATAAAGSVFAGWSGCDSVSGTDSRICTINMNKNRTVTATFNKSLGVECTRYGPNQYLYCRGFKSTDPQGSSCNAACSARGYSCPVGDNMIRSTTQILELAQTFGLWSHGEPYSFYAHSSYSSPYVRKDIYSGAKIFYFDSNWYQSCTHAPGTDWRYERIKICRCQDTLPERYTLSVRSFPDTGVPITSNTGHSDTTDYNKSVSAKTSVSLTASSPHMFGGEYYAFSSWTGCVSSKNQTISFSMPSSNITCTANYEKMNIMQYMGNQLASITKIVADLIEQLKR